MIPAPRTILELARLRRQLRTCPRCHRLADRIERAIGQPTTYWPCGHEDLSADLRVRR